MKTKRQKQRATVKPDRFLTPGELIEHFKVASRTVRRWQWEGLPHYRRGRVVRYSLREVEVWLATTFGPGRNQHCSYEYR